jgi:hypothetical protein
MDRYADHLYNRSMGLSYDEEGLARQVANGGRAGSEDFDDESTYALDGSDLMIAPVTAQLDAATHELERLKLKSERGQLRTHDIDGSALESVQRISQSLHNQYEELAEEDAKYARAVQDWTMAELLTRHPDFVVEQTETSPDEMTEQLYEIAEIVGELLIELHAEGEDEKLITLADTWRKELLADCMVAEFKHLYALAA